MDRPYEVLIFPRAEQDLADTRDYFLNILKTTSTQVFEKVLSTIAQLELNPLIYPQVKDSLLQAKGYRFVPIDNFLMFFVVVGKQVQIRRFLYGGRKYNSLL